MELSYVRIYNDGDGESHFQDAVMPLAAADLAPPMTPVSVSDPLPAARLLHLRAPQELDGSAWHTAPKRQFFYLLKGWVEITVSDGETRKFEPGDILLVEVPIAGRRLRRVRVRRLETLPMLRQPAPIRGG